MKKFVGAFLLSFFYLLGFSGFIALTSYDLCAASTNNKTLSVEQQQQKISNSKVRSKRRRRRSLGVSKGFSKKKIGVYFFRKRRLVLRGLQRLFWEVLWLQQGEFFIVVVWRSQRFLLWCWRV
jgi:hypothetical protein